LVGPTLHGNQHSGGMGLLRWYKSIAHSASFWRSAGWFRTSVLKWGLQSDGSLNKAGF